MVYPSESWSCFCASATTLANYHLPATHFSSLLPRIMLNFGHIFLHFLNALLYVNDIMLGRVFPLPCCQCFQAAAEVGEQIRGLWEQAAQCCQKPVLPVCPGYDLAPNECRVTRQFFLLLFCYYSLLLFIPFTGTTVASAATLSSRVYNGLFCQGSDI